MSIGTSSMFKPARGGYDAGTCPMKSNVPNAVQTRVTTEVFPTYLPAAPDRNPMFLEKRVYQGSSGKVYPLPCTDRIADRPIDRAWRAVWIENEFLRVLILPELGGRIHAIQDRTNGYDLIYHQRVIKPALVGLAGPWASGGIEFNWPQHHRPATFLPVDYEVEEHADGSQTVWCSDHDPMSRMKGMHGVCLHPGRAVVELKVRAYNRTPYRQTFLWWANVATQVHEAYQSFFPPDVYYVADHARRSMSEYPLAQGPYYGVDYAERGRTGIPPGETPRQYVPTHAGGKKTGPNYAPNDLSFYANIPVPTSYMGMGSREDFFGGYDYRAEAGLIHIASHHISPGKKQWTWGNHEFGYAWDRNLTDANASGEFPPYIEIMAGVYTDNQPDFSFLEPGETKSWSQYWYPIQKIGPAQHANEQAAVSLKVNRGIIRLGVAVTSVQAPARVTLTRGQRLLWETTTRLAPDAPLVENLVGGTKLVETELRLTVTTPDGRELITYQPKVLQRGAVPSPATEPRPPGEVASTDELYVIGLHLEQYRHATRCPTHYWREALRRDVGDARCNCALGRWHYQRGEFTLAEPFFRRAIARLTERNANPADGEAYYHLGLCLRRLGREDEAYDALYKAVWNQAWQAAGYHALAELDCQRGAWAKALAHLDQSLRLGTDNLRARNLKVIALRRLGQAAAAAEYLNATLALDPLDWWAKALRGEVARCDLPTALDVAHDFARAGLFREAMAWLKSAQATPGDLPDQSWGAAPLVEYTLGWLAAQAGDDSTARQHARRGSQLAPDYCFPSRLEDIAVLEWAMTVDTSSARPAYYLGNLLYDRRRHTEAIRLWERSAKQDGNYSVVWRNLGIAYFNIRQDARAARRAYDRALRANPTDARLLMERDQLWKRLGETPHKRLAQLRRRLELVAQRDDLTLEYGALLNQTGQAAEAQKMLASRKFQPWEGGEGVALGLHVRTHLALGWAALRTGNHAAAVTAFMAALTSPENLGEAKHLLANQSDIHYWLGCALAAQGKTVPARAHWQAAAAFKGDFQAMSVRAFSEMTFYSLRSLAELGEKAKAKQLFRALLAEAKKLAQTRAQIDYFATSLPTMLLFEDDLQFRQVTTARFIQAQAQFGLGRKKAARVLLQSVLQRDPNHALARDFWECFIGQPLTGTRNKN